MKSSSDIQFYINPKDSIRQGSKIKFTLMLKDELGFAEELKVYGFRKEEKCKIVELTYQKKKEGISYFTGNTIIDTIGVHYFFISLQLNGQTCFIRLKEETAQLSHEIANKEVDLAKDYWRITVYDAQFHVPDWAKGKVMYQIFVDRFYRNTSVSLPEMKGRILHKDWKEEIIWRPDEQGNIKNNDFFAGNLKGIEEKLDEIQDLGFDILYLSPIGWSQSNHRYDTSDYEKVDPYVGCNQDLKDLCQAAHQRNMYIILDAVFNHTGNDSKYFNEYGNFPTLGAFQSKESPYYEWYKKNHENGFEYWWGFPNLPVCNPNNPDWVNYICGEGGILDKWFALGIDGIRLDVLDELPESLIYQIRQAAKRNRPDAFLIGEVWENAILKEENRKQREYLLGTGVDSVMNYPFADAILKYIRFGDDTYLKQTYDEILHDYPEPCISVLMNSLSTHDITRAITTLAGEGIEYNQYQWTWDIGDKPREWQYQKDTLTQEQYELGVARFKLATILQMVSPGIPCVFYGDEIGMYGYKDPFNRKPYSWDNQDKEVKAFMKWIITMMKQYHFFGLNKNPIREGNENILELELTSDTNQLRIYLNRTNQPIRMEKKEEYKQIFYLNSTEEEIGAYGALIMIQ